ncbi:hypothetical protein C4D60_Mb09t21910 [Musa balbisiana]|uniref:Uncharacterized protein n=1 Tax=Musa balbisiana TaxID=52838 RepID=A0A4S8II53_MUSBA|nr:hypothetical protein C4D60_Mb09t21910 [Musa balbisiana]
MHRSINTPPSLSPHHIIWCERNCFVSSLMASNQIKTAAHARGGLRKGPSDDESRWSMEPADKITGISVGAASCVNSIKVTFEIDGTTHVTSLHPCIYSFAFPYLLLIPTIKYISR